MSPRSDLFGVDCDKLYDVEAAGGDMAAVVISGEVMCSVLWAKTGRPIMLLGKTSRSFLLSEVIPSGWPGVYQCMAF